MWYRADLEDDNFEMILADSDSEAVEKAYELEEEHGTVFNLYLLDDNDNKIRNIF